VFLREEPPADGEGCTKKVDREEGEEDQNGVAIGVEKGRLCSGP